MEKQTALGVDIGGSHITAKLVSLDTGMSISETEVREPVSANGTAEEIINCWCDVIDRAFGSDIRNKKIGIAMPGPFDYEKGIAWMKNQDKYDALYGLNIRELLAEKLAICGADIKFLNDAESFMKGEVFSGAAKGSSVAVGLTLGTGLGSAVYSNGRVVDANWWTSPFKYSIAEDYLSTRWFTHRYENATGKKVSGVKELSTYHAEKEVQEIFSEFGANLALFLRAKIEGLKVETIVLGGNISHAYNLFQNTLVENLSKDGSTVVKKALLGEEASLIGAASCWKENKTFEIPERI